MNLTITVDKEVLKRARIRAMEQDTSKREAMDMLARLSREASSRSGDSEWTREDLHKR